MMNRFSSCSISAPILSATFSSYTLVAKWLQNKLSISDAEEAGRICHDTWLGGDGDWRTKWPRKATSVYLYAQYLDNKKNDRYTQGPSGEAQFMKELRNILPSINSKRENSEKRTRYLELPPLDEAKREFEEYLNCDDAVALWGEDPEEDQGTDAA